MIQNWSINPAYKELNNPWKEHHDLKTTRNSIKEMLKNGTPDWIRFPNDYKAFAKESFQAEKEASDRQVLEYKMEGQDLLADFKARYVNPIATRDFVKKLRDNGIRCFTVYNGLPNTVALWAIVPTNNGLDAKYITYLQIPAMIEWDILRLDDHGLPNGLDYRGWRTVVSQLVRKGAVTEQRAHQIFGRPTDSIVSRKYREILCEFRHRSLNPEAKEF